jgi:hypothetical protein
MINNNKNEMIVKCLDVVRTEFNENTETSELTDNDMKWLACYFEEHCKVEPIDYDESNILEGMSW